MFRAPHRFRHRFTSHIRGFDWQQPIHWREQSEIRKLNLCNIIPRIGKLSTASTCRERQIAFWAMCRLGLSARKLFTTSSMSRCSCALKLLVKCLAVTEHLNVTPKSWFYSYPRSSTCKQNFSPLPSPIYAPSSLKWNEFDLPWCYKACLETILWKANFDRHYCIHFETFAFIPLISPPGYIYLIRRFVV